MVEALIRGQSLGCPTRPGRRCEVADDAGARAVDAEFVVRGVGRVVEIARRQRPSRLVGVSVVHVGAGNQRERAGVSRLVVE